MFGGIYFGQAYFGQGYPQKATTSLAATSTIGVATAAFLTITPILAAASQITVSSDVALNVSGPLLADSTIGVSSDALLSGATTLAAASTIAFSTSAARPIMTADLSAASTVQISDAGASYAGVVFESAPGGFWRLNGDATDAAFVPHNGTVNGTITFGQTGPLSDGTTAALFNGTTGYINIADDATQNPGTGSFSYECWVKRAAGIAVSEFIICKAAGGGGPGGGGELFLAASGAFFSRLADGVGGNAFVTSATGYADGNWHHVVVSMNRGTPQLGIIYVDGVAATPVDLSAFSTVNLSGAGQDLLIGKRPTGNFFAGTVKDVSIYNVALSAQQVAARYALRVATSTTALLPALTVGGIPLTSASTITLSSSAMLSGLAAQLAAASTIGFSSAADIRATGPSATTAVITFNGVVQTSNRIRKDSIRITDAVNETQNTCDFIVDLTPPAIGTDVKIGLQNVLPGNLIFGGTVITVDQVYLAGDRTIPSWSVSCVDYTYLMNRRVVVGSWTNLSATTVAQAIVTTFAPGFSTAGITASLPTITVAFNGVPVMAALAEIANLVGGYADVDYGKVVKLFIADTTDPPSAISGGYPLMNTPPITATSDESQLRTRVNVRGATLSVGGPEGFDLPAGSTQIPVDSTEAADLPTGVAASQVITNANDVPTYTGTASGGLASTVVSNVAPPLSSGVTAVATGVAGGLVGTYRYAVAYANANGETSTGPLTLPIVAPAVAAPTFGPGVGAPFSGAVGPLVGTYQYAVSFVNNLGETLRSPLVSRTASALAAPPAPIAADGPAAGNLQVGAVYRYAVSYVTAYGETGLSVAGAYAPSGLSPAGMGSGVGITFGGLYGGPYSYGISIVTAIGESAPPNTFSAGSGFATTAPSVTLAWTGTQDTAGRLAPGDYAWAISYYSDQYGEGPLGPQFLLHVGGAVTIRLLMSVPGGLPTNADGIRIYRALQGGNPLQLNADFRRGSVPSTYWDQLSQGECGNPFPIHPIRAGQSMQWTLSASTAPGVLARRIYRSKSGGSELFLVGEVQNNLLTTFTDAKFDTDLTARNPVVQTTGRTATVTLPTTTVSGILGRRIYRTQANGSIFFLIADIKDGTTPSYQDNAPDSALTISAPGASTAGGEQTQLSSVPTGPSGTLARKIYRTVAGGSELKVVGQISDNITTTFLDSVEDKNLGATAPLVSTAGASAVTISILPIGPPSITQRIIYRTAAGGTDLKYVDTVNDNTTTSYTDTKADTALGRSPLTTSTIGALSSDASVRLKSAAGWPSSGWFEGDGQIIRYTGISADTLTGIPPLITISSILRSGTTATATTVGPHGYTTGQRIVIVGANESEFAGSHTVTVTSSTVFLYDVPLTAATFATGTIKASQPGAIIGALAGGLTVQTVPMLTGVSGLANPIAPGSSIALWVVRNSAAGQAAIAASEGGDGVHETVVTDSALDSIAACQKRGDAELALFQFARVQVTYQTRDTKTRSGKTVHIALGVPQNLTGDFLIQTVTISQIDVYPRTPPLYAVTASNTKFSLQDVLRHVVLDI
jgi:hypothetical protein